MSTSFQGVLCYVGLGGIGAVARMSDALIRSFLGRTSYRLTALQATRVAGSVEAKHTRAYRV